MSGGVRVLYVASSGDLNGGAQVQYRYLIEGLRHTRFTPLVLLPAAGQLDDVLARAGVQTWNGSYPIWNRSDLLRWRHRIWLERRRARHRLVAMARTLAPQLVHGDINVGPYVVAIAQARDIPCVLHVRGRVKRQWIRRLGLARATTLVSIGDGYRDELLDRGVSGERVVVIPDATDLARFRPRVDNVLRAEDRSIGPDDVLFGIAGRIEPFKRQIEFLRAAEQVLAAGRRARFFVIGPPNPNRPWYTRRVRAFPAAHGIDRVVTFTGSRADMERVVASLDVVVTLSGGSVMLEAMACGVPVVTATARSRQLLQMVRDDESGRVVPAGDLDALARAMIALCDDADARRRMGATGRQRAETLFGRDRLVGDTVRLYDRLLADEVVRSATSGRTS